MEFFLDKFYNVNYIVQIWNRELPTEIERFKTFLSFLFYLKTYTRRWRAKNQNVWRR